MSKQQEQEQEDDRSVTRLQNRALRVTTRKLRREVRKLQAKADEIFTAVCTTETESDRWFGELWASADFRCGPKDHEEMVKQTLDTFEELRLLKAHVAELLSAKAQPTTE